MKIIARGAEAVIHLGKDGVLVKERLKKGYRIMEIDEALRTKRTRKETKLLREARRAGVLTPSVLKEEKFAFEMEFIEGEKVRDVLNKKTMTAICKEIGESIGKLHSFNIIHGDLTTSNMLLKEGKLYFIDFGLGFQSSRIEDKAVDIHLLREALDSTHWEIAEKAWKIILKAYQINCSDAKRVLDTLGQIEKRGRYAKR